MNRPDREHDDVQPPAPPIEVPQDALSADALRSLIESFILREGTDYGREEVELATKVKQIQRQLDKGEIKIIFDPETETVSLITLTQWKRL